MYADLDLGMISLAKAAGDPAGHYSRPDVTRLLLNKTPGDRVVMVQAPSRSAMQRASDETVPPLARGDDWLEAQTVQRPS